MEVLLSYWRPCVVPWNYSPNVDNMFSIIYMFFFLSITLPPSFSFLSLFSPVLLCLPSPTILSCQRAKEVADHWPLISDCGKNKTFCKWEWPETDFRSFRMIAKKIPGFEVTESGEPGRSLGYEWSHLVENTVWGPLSCCTSCVIFRKWKAMLRTSVWI